MYIGRVNLDQHDLWHRPVEQGTLGTLIVEAEVATCQKAKHCQKTDGHTRPGKRSKNKQLTDNGLSDIDASKGGKCRNASATLSPEVVKLHTSESAQSRSTKPTRADFIKCQKEFHCPRSDTHAGRCRTTPPLHAPPHTTHIYAPSKQHSMAKGPRERLSLHVADPHRDVHTSTQWVIRLVSVDDFSEMEFQTVSDAQGVLGTACNKTFYTAMENGTPVNGWHVIKSPKNIFKAGPAAAKKAALPALLAPNLDEECMAVEELTFTCSATVLHDEHLANREPFVTHTRHGAVKPSADITAPKKRDLVSAPESEVCTQPPSSLTGRSWRVKLAKYLQCHFNLPGGTAL